MSLKYGVIFICYLNMFEVHTSKARQELVKVSLYYESLCPYCREFIVDQLYPGYVKIKNSLRIDLVPFGNANKAKIGNKWKFTCQHGPNECLGNKMQACTLRHELSVEKIMGFISCMMNSTDPASFINGKLCSARVEISWSVINDCAQSQEGDRLLAYYGNRTLALIPKLQYVPHILFNGAFNKTLEDDARNDFLGAVCQLFNVRPQGCNTLR